MCELRRISSARSVAKTQFGCLAATSLVCKQFRIGLQVIRELITIIDHGTLRGRVHRRVNFTQATSRGRSKTA
jgi:hypothetical protein